ncbi:HNH endonuclease signature motif containing protein [Dietzia sp. ANT_WB102]|uniref:HNH endonuclease signature motif containing protein n=1 Tax=Dietzia sp. ANT_WB102 TaxID=2597345 RepID=UPI0011F06217|nr:HNH endonuclease signature motif containing protein [Dietzia sp. ANT_WB102]KAA0917302.1 DUF222 domain-containing protein [Dietzia sp. ANT_WB102]
MAENRAAAQRLVACYELFRQCQRQEESGVGAGECRPGHAVVDPVEVAVGYVVAVMAVSTRRAEAMITFAFDLHTRYPAVLAALSAGRLDQRAAQVLASQMATVHVDVLELVQQQVVEDYLAAIEGGIRLGEKAVRGNVDAIIARYDADGLRLRRREAARTRGVRFHKGIDGMSSVSATLATEEAAVLAEALDHRVADHKYADAQARANTAANVDAATAGDDGAARDKDEDYSLAERRADALMSLLCGDTGLTGPPGAAGRPGAGGAAGVGLVPLRPQVTVIATGNDARDEGGVRVEFTRTGQAALQALLDLLAASDGASLERLDPGIGAADDARAALTYRPGAALARRIRLRDGTCRHPGCAVPADHCDLDHAAPFNHADPDRGGHTVEGNLVCLCRRHHRFKTFSDWSYTLAPDGTLHVTTPDGSTMRTRPCGPLAQYRREQADAETQAWQRQQPRNPDPTDTDPTDAEPTFWSRRATRHRTERARTEHARTAPAPTSGTSNNDPAANQTSPNTVSRWWARNTPHHSDIEKGIRTLLHDHLDELIDPPPF